MIIQALKVIMKQIKMTQKLTHENLKILLHQNILIQLKEVKVGQLFVLEQQEKI